MAQQANGLQRDAIVTLEKHLRHPKPCVVAEDCAQLGEILEDYTRLAAPDLPTYGCVDRTLASLEYVDLIAKDDPWKFRRGPSPGAHWADPEYKDRAWPSSLNGIGYSKLDSAGFDETGGRRLLYLRRTFDVPGVEAIDSVILSVLAYDDCTAYLNGRKISLSAPAAPSKQEGQRANRRDRVTVSVTLPAGYLQESNLLAVNGFDRSFDKTLFLVRPTVRGRLKADAVRKKEEALLEAYRLQAKATDAVMRLTYLEGRLFQRRGEYAAASQRFAKIVKQTGEQPEPLIRLAECLRAAGRADEAERLLRGVLEKRTLDDRSLWQLWLAIATAERKQSPGALLASFPEGDETSAYARDVRWLLERLAKGETIGINCGGKELPGQDGVTWGRDRFFEGGWIGWGRSDITGADDPPLFQRTRRFDHRYPRTASYDIPLPPDTYAVTLHFAEAFSALPEGRTFDVVIEGETKLKAYTPSFLAAERHSYDVAVEDGLLSITFTPRRGNPHIAGIEIVPLGK